MYITVSVNTILVCYVLFTSCIRTFSFTFRCFTLLESYFFANKNFGLSSWTLQRRNKRLLKIFKMLRSHNRTYCNLTTTQWYKLDNTKQFNKSITERSYPISHKNHSMQWLARALIFYTMFTDTCALHFCILESQYHLYK